MLLLRLINLLRERKRTLVVAVFAPAVLLGAYGKFGPQEYRVTAVLAPEASENSLARLAGLAAQFGVPVGGEAGQASVDFFARVLESRELLGRLALHRYASAAGQSPDSATYIELLEIGGDDSREQLENAVEELRKSVLPGVDVAAGLLSIRASAPQQDLAEALARRAIVEVNAISLRAQQERAASERGFLAARVDSAAIGLREAEDRMREFLTRNRSYESSPELVFEAGRLQRRVELQQQVYVTLVQALEQARISEVRNTPLVSVIDAPEGAAERHGRTLIFAFLGAFIGFVGALAVLLGPTLAREFVSKDFTIAA